MLHDGKLVGLHVSAGWQLHENWYLTLVVFVCR